jgi:hypothetical protein
MRDKRCKRGGIRQPASRTIGANDGCNVAPIWPPMALKTRHLGENKESQVLENVADESLSLQVFADI